MNMGAVGGIRNVKDAIGVARRVLENTQHSFLVGSLASDFAHNLGFPSESLDTNYSTGLYETWKQENCQPNFWTVSIRARTTCNFVARLHASLYGERQPRVTLK